MTVVAVSPGSSDSLLEQVLQDGGPERVRGPAVVMAGLVTAFAAASSAFAQFERGANRIYGVQRDRPLLLKYARRPWWPVRRGPDGDRTAVHRRRRSLR